MAAARKVFRIEQTNVLRQEPPGDDPAAAQLRHAAIMDEFGALRAMLAALATPPRRAPAGKPRFAAEKAARARRALEAVCKDSEAATQKILAAAEEIDQAANNLSAALNGRIEQALAQDIRDHAIQIFEACNFQDLIGQRLAIVTTALTPFDDESAPARGQNSPNAEPAVHGPRLDGDRDHLSQAEIDVLFRPGRRSA